MADDVFKPQAGTKLNVTFSRAEAPNVILHVPREVEIEIVSPLIEVSEVGRRRPIGKRAANEIPPRLLREVSGEGGRILLLR